MSSSKININPRMLRWAREKAGLTLDEAVSGARISGLKARGKTPALLASERLNRWEQGLETPRLSFLEKLAHLYHRPLLTFFLSSPPVDDSGLKDFRKIGGSSSVDSPEFTALKTRIELLHEELKAVFEEEGAPALPFVGSLTLDVPEHKAAQQLREVLDFSWDDQIALSSSTELIRTLRRSVQDSGIFVLFEGNLGSYHTDISVAEFRGVSIGDLQCPLIVVNPNDAKAAQLFTLVHELVHILLGESAISAFDSLQVGGNQTDIYKKEQYCNAVAAEFLVPESAVRRAWDTCENQDLFQILSGLARQFRVSRAVIARRLFDLGLIETSEYRGAFGALQKEWENQKKRQKQKDGWPPRNTLDKYRLGDKLIGKVFSAVYDGHLSLRDASRVLRVKVDRFDRIAL